MYLIDYSATIIPIFCAMGLYYFLEKWLNKTIHQNLRGIFVPAISLFVVAPLTILVFGPFGVFTGDLLSNFFTWLNETNSILLGAVFAAAMLFLVLFGFFWAVFPIFLQNLTTTGYDPLLVAAAAYNFAIFGVAFGFYLKSKNKELKSIALSATLTGLLAGLSEPALYGLVIKHSRTIPIVIGASALGGALLGAMNVQSIAFAFTNIFTVGIFTPFIPYLIGIIVSFCLGAAGVFLFGYEKSKSK